MKGNAMFQKIRNLDPMTKSTIKACAVQLSITAVLVTAMVILEKRTTDNTDADKI